MIRYLCSQAKINITKTAHHASLAVLQLFKGSFVQSFSLHYFITWNDHFLARDCRMGLTLQDKLEQRVFGEMCCLSHPRLEAVIFQVLLQLPWWVSWPGHPLVHEVSTAPATSYHTSSQGQGEAMLLELLAELALVLLCQNWVGNKEKILRSNPMWPQFSVSCFPLKTYVQVLRQSSFSVWGDFADYKFS